LSIPLRTVRLGQTASFSATLLSSDAPPSIAHVDITIKRIDDPSDLVIPKIRGDDDVYPQPPPAGYRNVAMNVTIENTGNVPLGEGGQEYTLTLNWGLNPTNAALEGSYHEEGLPSENCHGGEQPPTQAIFEGQSRTGCILFPDIPNEVPMTAALGWVEFAGHGQIPTMWIMK
jgi:hypothetical protein